MMKLIAWLIVPIQRGWIRVKFIFRNISLRFERMAYLARMFNLLRHGQFTEDGFIKSIPCLANDPPVILRWVGELRDLAFYLGHRFDRKMAIFIVKDCQALFRERLLCFSGFDESDLSDMKRKLYKLAGQLKSVMTPVSISESANFLLGRIYAVVRRTVAGSQVEEEMEDEVE